METSNQRSTGSRKHRSRETDKLEKIEKQTLRENRKEGEAKRQKNTRVRNKKQWSKEAVKQKK